MKNTSSFAEPTIDNSEQPIIDHSPKASDSEQVRYSEDNQHFLLAFVEYIKYRLAQAYGCDGAEQAHKGEHSPFGELFKRDIDTLLPIDHLSHLYQLTAFEQQLLLLCIAPELDSELLYPNGVSEPIVVNFSLALAILPFPEWQAIMASGSLRRHGLIQVEDNPSLTQSRLSVPESILHFIMGLQDEDQTLRAYVEVLPYANVNLDASNESTVKNMLQTWQHNQQKPPCLMTLTGELNELKRDVAVVFAHQLSRRLILLQGRFIPKAPNELYEFATKWQREILLSHDLLIVECDESLDHSEEHMLHIDHFFNLLKSSVLCMSGSRRQHYLRSQFTFEVYQPSSKQQSLYWQAHLTHPQLHSEIEAISSHFDLSFSQIRSLVDVYQGMKEPVSLWELCRQHTHQPLDHLAERIVPATGVNIVLPPLQTTCIENMISHVKYKAQVYEKWGFGTNGGRGKGLVALFHGASGTGKTTAAEYIASHLKLDLYRVDLSHLTSKYIGETEKNLSQLFLAAERSGAILLFDEADALFSKRTQVSTSNDKFANAQVSYLLQRLETYRGIAILTSNLKDSFDAAFIRRLRFVIGFPFPTACERERLWRTLIPNNAPIGQLNFKLLSRLSVSGGMIRNITLTACFNAAAAQSALEMTHFLMAVKSEYAKQDKPLCVQEIRGWA
ncbi:ATP-binding protein [uncultured Shewanella sp.]|uniref:ATP-binding protein n=1 Tax=uncultured Shewanella sp. TaxID=173975 RepID=UPI002601D977|nr:ATP-binding protein [uncultured Shewanella sp.]